MAETAKEWAERVFASIIEDNKIIIAKAVKKVSGKKGAEITRPTGASIYVMVDTFASMFEEEIRQGGSDLKTANRIAKKPLGYTQFIEDMKAKGMFG